MDLEKRNNVVMTLAVILGGITFFVLANIIADNNVSFGIGDVFLVLILAFASFALWAFILNHVFPKNPRKDG